MVQAGSGMKPESIPELRKELSLKRRALLDAQAQHDEAQRQLEVELAKAENISKEELVEAVTEEVETAQKLEERIEEIVDVESRLKTIVRSFQSGGMAGVIARTCVAPMDRIKILQQTSAAITEGGGAEYAGKSIVQVMRLIVSKEGVGGLWRGNFTNCVRVFPHAATQFTAYDYFKSVIPMLFSDPTSYLAKVVCGGMAGAAAVTVTHPMDLVRIRLQTQPELKGIGDSVRQILARDGVRGFYRGYTSAVLSLSPFIAVNFTSFDIIKGMYFGPQAHLTQRQIKKQNPMLNLVFGAASGLVAQTVCYPLDTVRRRMALAGSGYTSNFNAVTTIAAKEGIRGFYKGMLANAMKVAPNNAIRFFAFEFIKNHVL